MHIKMSCRANGRASREVFYEAEKWNAVLGLGIVAALLCHAGTMVCSLLTGWYDLTLCKGFARAAVALLVLHVLTTLCIFFFKHDGASARYARQNARTWVQRVTALLILILIHTHTMAYAHMATGETLSNAAAIFFCIAESVYILAVCAHTAASFGKAFVTLGWLRSSKAAKRLDAVAYTVCCLIAAAALFALQSKDRAEPLREAYDKHFATGCSKALSCVGVCPMGIDTLASMARMNRFGK